MFQAENKATSDSTSTSYGNSFTVGDVIGVAYDMDSGKIWFSKNGTFQASGDPVAGTNAAFTDLSGTVVPLIVTYASNKPRNFWSQSELRSTPICLHSPKWLQSTLHTELAIRNNHGWTSIN